MVTVIIYKLFEQAVANKQQVTFAKFADLPMTNKESWLSLAELFQFLHCSIPLILNILPVFAHILSTTASRQSGTEFFIRFDQVIG